MKNIILLSLSLLFYVGIYSQTLTQDAQGNSTIFYNGGSAGIDLLRGQVGISYNNTFKPKSGSLNKFVVGANGQVKNESGLIGVIKGSDFNPNIDVSLKLGGSHYFGGINKLLILTNEKKDQLQTEVDIIMAKPSIDSVDLVRLNDLSTQISYWENFETNEQLKTNFNRIVYYFEGNYNNTQVNILNDASSSIISEKVSGRNFSNGSLKFGVNYEYNSFLIGTKIGLGTTNNLFLLKPNQVTLIYDTDSLQDGAVQNSNTRNVYNNSKVQNFGYFGWDIDLVNFFPVAKNGEIQGTLVFSPLYTRYIRNLSFSSDILNIGASINYFGKNGKFFGGMYVQLNNSTQWAANTVWNDKFQIGITTRFNFKSLQPADKEK